MKKIYTYILSIVLLGSATYAQNRTEFNRPKFHYTPQQNWMNDPNGMVYLDGEYHLFYQHDRYDKVFSDMSWGHAISTDLVHWKELPKAIVPDSDGLGMIFSGSAVLDKDNTSGFGANTLVAFYTSTHPIQQQSMAYSTDKGRTWIKYAANPVIKNTKDDNIPDDFRDPKVMWHKGSSKWIMSLAVKDHVEFWSSKNLKDWVKESEFGQNAGSHGGVWECPDLIQLPVDGDVNNKKWVLLLSINPGGPNGGSATQYFIGDFDGHEFIMDRTSEEVQWVDYGSDNYAGVTYSNVDDRAIAIGWMSNWSYAMAAPTSSWRGAMTIPRQLSLKTIGNLMHVVSEPVKELNSIAEKAFSKSNVQVKGILDLSLKQKNIIAPYRLDLDISQLKDFSIILSNDIGEQLIVGYDKAANQYYIDRSQSSKQRFDEGFFKKHTAPRLSKEAKSVVSLWIDATSVEFFADNGLNVMTDNYFSTKPLSKLSIQTPDRMLVSTLVYSKIQSIWSK